MTESETPRRAVVGESDQSGDWGEIVRADAIASLVVFLVALPLCIGIAVAVGISPAKAIITGIIGGIVVGWFAGSPLQVSGPAAGLFVIVADQIAKHRNNFLAGHPEYETLAEAARKALDAAALEYACGMLGLALLIGGAIQIAAGRLGLGQWFRAVSPAVIHGMLAGIGILIIVSQLHVMLDHSPIYHGHKAHGGLEHALTLPDAFYKTIMLFDNDHHHLAAIIGVASIAVILLWQKLATGPMKLVPGALLAVVVGTFLAWFLNFGVERLQVPTNLLAEATWPSFVTLQGLLDPDVVMGGFVVALVASAETLLCATAVDQMHTGPRTDYDQELAAQGIGNMLCGLVGCLPLSGVIVRSSANVQAGARSRMSTILHGFWLLLFVLFLPMALGLVPKACLGAILVFTGIKLIDFGKIGELWKVDRSEVAIFLVTMSLIVIEDLLVGVIVGISLSSIKLLYTFTHLEVELISEADSNRRTIKLIGAATFVRLPVLAQWLDRVPPGAELTVDLTHLHYIDHACLELLTNWETQHATTGGSLVIDWNSLQARFRNPAKVGAKPGENDSAPQAASHAGDQEPSPNQNAAL